jgi:hypothetical protein
MYHGVTPETASKLGEQDGVPAATVEAAPDSGGPEASGKKERVLHTRVPAVLERELKRFAENLRIPVSNLVRAILEDAMTAANAASESVEGRLKRAAEQLEREREKLNKKVRSDPFAGVYAFQAVSLAQPAACARCGKELSRGDGAHLGMTDPPPRSPNDRVFVCNDCLPAT